MSSSAARVDFVSGYFENYCLAKSILVPSVTLSFKINYLGTSNIYLTINLKSTTSPLQHEKTIAPEKLEYSPKQSQ